MGVTGRDTLELSLRIQHLVKVDGVVTIKEPVGLVHNHDSRVTSIIIQTEGRINKTAVYHTLPELNLIRRCMVIVVTLIHTLMAMGMVTETETETVMECILRMAINSRTIR